MNIALIVDLRGTMEEKEASDWFAKSGQAAGFYQKQGKELALEKKKNNQKDERIKSRAREATLVRPH